MVGDSMKKRKRKINKKRILILILFLWIILSIGIYLIVPKRYGYQKDVINVFKEDNYYEKIKDTKHNSSTGECEAHNWWDVRDNCYCWAATPLDYDETKKRWEVGNRK